MAFARLKAFFQDSKRDPKRSYNLILDEHSQKPTYWQRLYGVYRIFTGRLNEPKTVIAAHGVPTESPSKNHAGLYDYLTAGALNAIESFASGNWIETPRRRTVWKILWSPIWAPLNALRAMVSAVATLFSALPLVFIHRSELKKVDAAEQLAAKQLALEAASQLEKEKAKPGEEIDLTAASTPEPSPTLTRRASSVLLAAAPRKSRDVINEEKFDKTTGQDAAAFRAKLLHAATPTESTYWKVTETSKEITAKLVAGKAKHPERYASVEVALPPNTKSKAVSSLVKDRIANTVGNLPKKAFKKDATIAKDDDILSAKIVADKKGFKLFQKKGSSTSSSNKKSVSAIVPRFGQ